MLTALFAVPLVLAFHQGGGGGADIGLLLIVLGAIATPVWLLFSTMVWRNTLLVAATAWAVGLGLAYGI